MLSFELTERRQFVRLRRMGAAPRQFELRVQVASRWQVNASCWRNLTFKIHHSPFQHPRGCWVRAVMPGGGSLLELELCTSTATKWRHQDWTSARA